MAGGKIKSKTGNREAMKGGNSAAMLHNPRNHSQCSCISYPSLCNKSPQTQQLKATNMCYITVSVGQTSESLMWLLSSCWLGLESS